MMILDLTPGRLLAAVMMLTLCGFAGERAYAEEVPKSRDQINLSFAPLVKTTAPAVVNVYAKRIRRQQGFVPFGSDPFFRRFFGGDGFLGRPRERVQNSLGSGVIVDSGGFIVTNHHVIKGGTDIRVVLSDRREFEAKILVADERTDLAVLKIDTKGSQLPFLELGDSDALEVGDLVLAIGNPFGVGQTVTSGIISALARTRVGVSNYQFFIQTDAAINPGNSGGALVDTSGQLIGINTAIFSRSGGSVGIGFAIPANMVRSVIFSARGDGKVVRPWNGVEVQDVTADIAESLGFRRPVGALVVNAHPLSPLSKAGIKRGDVLLTVNGKEIANAREFAYRFATLRIGNEATIGLRRKGKGLSVQAKLIEPPEVPPRRQTRIKGRSPFAGLLVANLSPAVAEELGVSPNARGVAIIDVGRGPARRVGFKKGDILVEINDQTIDNVGTLRSLLRLDDDWWEFSISRGGKIRRIRLGG
ncbi:MAG: DegQ family serine endoprotease [Aestuariivirgaceae bacterium]